MPLNTREIAILLWAGGLFAFSLQNEDIRRSYSQIFTSLAQRKILLILLLHICNTAVSIYLLNSLGIWNNLNLKASILWFVFTSFAGIVKYATDHRQTLDSLIYYQVKLIIIIEFIAGLKTFSLLVELIIVPAVGFTVIFNAISKTIPNGKAAEKLSEWLLVIFGIMVFVLGSLELFKPGADFLKLIEEMSAPVALSIFSIPFLYGLFLYSAYEEIIFRINIFNKNDSSVRRYAKFCVLRRFHFLLPKLRKAGGRLGYDLGNAQSKMEASLIVDECWRKVSDKTTPGH